MDFETETFVVASTSPTLGAASKGRPPGTDVDTVESLIPIPFDTTQVTSRENRSRPEPGSPCHPLAAGGHPPALAFSMKDHGADAGELCPTIRAGGHAASHANGGVPPAVAFHVTQDPISSAETTPAMGCGNRQECGTLGVATPILEPGRRSGRSTNDARIGIGIGDPGDPMFTLPAERPHGVHTGMSVRRLTPRECERLQGFPDDYTLIPWGKGIRPEKLDLDWVKYLMRGGRMSREECARAASDGPRYRALGNSMAVTVMGHIGLAIHRVNEG